MISINMLDNAPIRQLPLDALRTFVAAARFGNFTRAGEAVHRTQSAVSMQIKRLEGELGRPLFHRHGRTTALTGDGERLLGYARRLIKLHDEALADLSAPHLAGVVRLGVPDDYASTHLTHVLARFAEVHPRVRVEITCDTTPDLLTALDRGLLDLCLTTGPGDADTPGQVARNPLVWACAAGMELDAIWNRTEPLPLAVFHEGCLHRRSGIQALERAHIPYRVTVSSVSLAAVLAALRTGLAVSPLPLSSLTPECRVIPAGAGLPELPLITVSLQTITPHPAPAVDQLARCIREQFRAGGAPAAT